MDRLNEIFNHLSDFFDHLSDFYDRLGDFFNHLGDFFDLHDFFNLDFFDLLVEISGHLLQYVN